MKVTERTWRVRDVMSEELVTTTPDTPFKILVEQILLDGVCALPVLGPEGNLVGVVSETDLVTKQEHQAGGEALQWTRHLLRLADNRDSAIVAATLAEFSKAAGRTAEDVMTSPAITIEPDATLTKAASLMHRRGVNQLPVLDGGQLIGIVTRGDLLKAFLRTDREIELDAAEAIHSVLNEPDAITVAVAEGVVTLQGEVASQVEAEVAVGTVGAVSGVVGVDDYIRTPI